MSKKQIKPTWIYDKQGNIRKVHAPINAKGETISLNSKTMTGKIGKSVGFHPTSNERFENEAYEMSQR